MKIYNIHFIKKFVWLLILLAFVGSFTAQDVRGATTTPCQDIGIGLPEGTCIFSNGNVGSVYNNPTSSTTFTLTNTYRILSISNYHWNNAMGASPGTIGLKDITGKTYGPWAVTTRPGQGGVPNAVWDAKPDIVLGPGTYTIIDSDTSTWSQNSESKNQGMSVVKGTLASSTTSPTATPTVVPTSKKCEGTTPYLYIEDRTMDKGKTVEIPVMMCNADNLANMDLTINYDSSILKIKDIIKGSLNAKALFDWNDVSAGKLKISFASKEGVSGSGSIAVMKFDVVGNEGATTTITGTVSTASKADDSKITVNVNPGTFTVGTSTTKGDCNGDGKLDERDALAALQMAVEKRAVDMCYDYNKDGKVDSSDAREMLKAIVGTGGGQVPTGSASGQPISISISGQTITVTQAGSLKDLAFTFSQAPPSNITVSVVDESQAPPVPDGVTRLSDFFRVSPVEAMGGMITVTMPTQGLPAGRSAKDLRLYIYSDSASEAEAEISGPFWMRTWYDFNVLRSGKVTIKLQGLGDLSFIGIEAPVIPPEVTPTNCLPKAFDNGTTDPNQQVCTVIYDVGKSFIVTVKNIGDLHLTPVATLNELLDWIAAGRKAFDGYGLLSDPQFEVDVGPMPADIPNAFGYVSSREDRKTLHITNKPESKNVIQGTAVHEYFHHAQSRTKEVGKTNLIDTDHKGDWLIEGLARWVEDDIFDNLNTYKLKEKEPLPPILGEGLGAVPDKNNKLTRGYARFAFWKMVQSSCSGFSIPHILNVNVGMDPVGIANFKSMVESQQWQCDFGAGFGDSNRGTLASALLYYTYATVKEDDISKLDSDEAYFRFDTDIFWHLDPSFDCTIASCPPIGSKTSLILPPASAVSLVVNEVPNTDNRDVMLLLTPTPNNADIWVWSVSLDRPNNFNEGKWLRTSQGNQIKISEGSRSPKTLVVVVNPDPSATLKVQVAAGVTLSVTPTPTVTISPTPTPATTLLSRFGNCSIFVSYDGTYSALSGQSSPPPTSKQNIDITNTYYDDDRRKWVYVGSFSGNTFTASIPHITFSNGKTTDAISMSITVDPVSGNILSFSGSRTGPSPSEYRDIVSGTNFPNQNPPGTPFQRQENHVTIDGFGGHIYGSTANNYISDLQARTWIYYRGGPWAPRGYSNLQSYNVTSVFVGCGK